MASAKFSGESAMLEYMLQGNRITVLEAFMLFGVQGPAIAITRIKRKGFIVKSGLVPMIAVVRRINEMATIQPPSNLPMKEIQLREYWISR